MKLTSRLVSGAVALAMAGAVPAPADGAGRDSQPASDAASGAVPQASSRRQPPPELHQVIVSGIRQSMESALHIKRFSDTIVDSIVARHRQAA